VKSAFLVLALIALQITPPQKASRPAPREKPPAASSVKTSSASAKPALASNFQLNQYLPHDTVFIVGCKPAEILRSRMTTALVQYSGCQDSFGELVQIFNDKTGLNLADVEEVIAFADVAEVARIQKARRLKAAWQRLKLIGLAMHNFHDTFNALPQHSGMSNGPNGNLSWRVFLLPYLGYESLYQQFDLGASWDAPQNLKLISQMPKEFLTEGVDEVGKTSIHVLGGEGTPFGEKSPIRFADITDDRGQTIMAVQAGSDKAQFWTKPGPLEFHREAPVSSLGNFGEVCVGVAMDASPLVLGANIEPEILNAFAGHQDGIQLSENEEEFRFTRLGQSEWPAVWVRTARPLDQMAIIEVLTAKFGRPDFNKGGVISSVNFKNLRLLFPDAVTMILASPALSERIAPGKKSETNNSLTSQFWLLFQKSQFVMMGSGSAMNSETGLMASQYLPDLEGRFLSSQITINCSESADRTVTMDFQMNDRVSALQLKSMLKGLSMIGQALVLESLKTHEDVKPQTFEIAADFFDSLQIVCEDNSVHAYLPAAENITAPASILAPTARKMLVAYLAKYEEEQRWMKEIHLRRLTIALSDYLDEFQECPPAASPGNCLSWRVALLPYLGEHDLYEQFHLNEPWNSPHNSQLIPKMPKVFATREVKSPGKTAYHVFDGAGSPFNSENPARKAEVFAAPDLGLILLAASDTADVWTKPGGLQIGPDMPMHAFGADDSEFMIASAFGQIRRIDKQTDAATMQKVIRLKQTMMPRVAKELTDFERFLESGDTSP